MKHLVKDHWLDRAVQIHNFHVTQCKSESGWTVAKTAESLNRSIGSVSQDILIARWVKTHEKQLRRLRSMRMALSYIKNKEKEMMREIDI